MAVELADLEAFLEIIAGTAVGKRGLGIQGLPFGQNVVFVLLDEKYHPLIKCILPGSAVYGRSEVRCS